VSYEKPEVGQTYQPASDIVPVSDGLPRTVTSISTRAHTERFIVNFETRDGSGFESDNLWSRWMSATGAVKITRLPSGIAHGLQPETVGDLMYRQHGGR
jgi:hypothetical protein